MVPSKEVVRETFSVPKPIDVSVHSNNGKSGIWKNQLFYQHLIFGTIFHLEFCNFSLNASKIWKERFQPSTNEWSDTSSSRACGTSETAGNSTSFCTVHELSTRRASKLPDVSNKHVHSTAYSQPHEPYPASDSPLASIDASHANDSDFVAANPAVWFVPELTSFSWQQCRNSDWHASALLSASFLKTVFLIYRHSNQGGMLIQWCTVKCHSWQWQT